ncbi:hypothetical protein [Acidovorax delafieldii]|uniref:hypothetical protein n=1 Tax=Acidovorax delafieldii TaxID=47920 RepID=UPI003ECFE3EE
MEKSIYLNVPPPYACTPYCKQLSEGNSVQNIPHGPVNPADPAGYFALDEMTEAADREMHNVPIYKRGDPCLDGYFSIEKNHLIFGARRLGPSGIILDAMTCSFSPAPFNEVLGGALLVQLSLTKKTLSSDNPTYHEIQSGKYDPRIISESDSYAEFSIKYRPFSLWTKDDDSTPYFMGVPVSDQFPLGKNSRPIQKIISSEGFGAEVKNLLNYFII